MTDLSQKFTILEGQLSEQHEETLTKVESVKGGDAISLTEINNLMGLMLTAIDNLRGVVEDLAGTVELLNNNSSLNAQNQQTIMLGAVGACCIDTAYGTGEIDDLCQLSQDAISFVASRMQSIGATYSGVGLPSVADLITLFTYVGTDGRSYQLLAAVEANKLLAALAALGVGNLSDLSCLLTDEQIKSDVLELLGTSNSAEQSTIRIPTLPPTGYTCSPGAAKAFFAAFSPTLINTLWKDPPIWDAAPYDDICGGGPLIPPDAYGYGFSSALLNWDEERTLYHTGELDMSTWTESQFFPVPADAPGYNLYIRNCFNDTTASDKNLYICSSSTDFDTLVYTLPVNETIIVTTTDAFPVLYVWTYSVLFEELPKGWQIVMAWHEEDVEPNCSEPE